MPQEATGSRDQLPESRTTRQYLRCLDRLFQSLPTETQHRMFAPMVAAAVRIGSGVALFDAVNAGQCDTAEDRDSHRERALAGIRESREGLDEIARVPGADRAELLVARELLERIEGSVRRA